MLLLLKWEETVRNELLLGSVAVFTLTSLSVNASAQSNIKAALLDMSAIVGMGTVGMMSPGTMPGTTLGPGTMGPGEMGNAMTGMMGMMGVMAIRLDHNPVKAGDITFDVTNWKHHPRNGGCKSGQSVIAVAFRLLAVKGSRRSNQNPRRYGGTAA